MGILMEAIMQSPVTGIIVSGTIGGLFSYGLVHSISQDDHIPETDEVQAGYVVPSRLEIKLQDLDRNGKEEVILRYDRNNYRLMVDQQGRPQVRPYSQ